MNLEELKSICFQIGEKNLRFVRIESSERTKGEEVAVFSDGRQIPVTHEQYVALFVAQEVTDDKSLERKMADLIIINARAKQAIKNIKEGAANTIEECKCNMDEMIARKVHAKGPKFERLWNKVKAQQGPTVSSVDELLAALSPNQEPTISTVPELLDALSSNHNSLRESRNPFGLEFNN